MTYDKRDFKGGAPSTTLASDITNASTTIALTSGTGFPSGGASGDFFVAIGSLQSNGTFTNLEVIRLASRSGNTLTVQTSGRGSDDTTAVAHTAGETIFHCMTALDAYEANHHIADTTLDHHTQYLNTTRHDVTARHTFGSAFATPSAPPSTSTSNAAGSAAGPARSDHTHAIGALSVVAGSLAALSVATGDIAANAITTAKITDANITTAKIADTNVTLGKLDTTVAKGVIQIVTTVSAYVGTPTEGAQAYETTNHRRMVWHGATDTWQPGDWNAPWGYIGSASTTTQQSSISTVTDLTSGTALTVTFTAIANRRYRITGHVPTAHITTQGEETISITTGTPTTLAASIITVVGGQYANHYLHTVQTPSAGSITYKLRAAASAGTITTNVSSTQPASILVEDIGANGAPS